MNAMRERTDLSRRLRFAIAAAVLLLAECLIALFLHDRWIRPYGGDILVVILLYCLLRACFPKGLPWLWLGVFAFAALVEALQGQNLVGLLGLSHSTFFRTLLGTSFSWGDIACYGVGSLVNLGLELGLRRKQRR